MKNRIVITVLFAAINMMSHAQSFSSSCIDDGNPIAECVVTNPKVLNLFWSTSEVNWNADAAAALPATFENGREQLLSVARLNAFVEALIRSSYFSQLEQYFISPPEFIRPHIVSGQLCEDPNLVGTFGGLQPPSADFLAMQSLLNCVKQNNSSTFEDVTMVILFIPPQVTPNVALGLGPCSGYHILIDNLPVVVIPLSCFDLTINPLSLILGAISSELAEAMTNKDPLIQTGFVDQTESNLISIGPLRIAREIGGVCNQRSFFINSSTGGGSTLDYWSQEDGNCVSGFEDLTTPVIDMVQFIGSGQNMKINIAGSGFGDMPHDLQAGNHLNDSSLYLRIRSFRHIGTTQEQGVEIGHAYNPLSSGVGVRGISWTPNLVQINGFGGNSGSPNIVLPGDRILISISNQSNGRFAQILQQVPLPNRIVYDAGNLPIAPNSSLAISGVLVDANNNRLGNVPFRLAASAGTLSTSDLSTDSQGQFQVQFTAPLTAGPVVMTATFPILETPPDFSLTFIIDVVPVIESITPIYGNHNGSTLVTINGRGFLSENTEVHFNNDPNGILANVSSNTQLTVQAPPSGIIGLVPLTVSVSNVYSRPPNDFIYYKPFSPIFSFKKGPACAQAELTSLLLKPDGSPAPNLITNISVIEGRIILDDGSLVQSISERTNSEGIVRVKMTAVGNSNTLSIYGNSQLSADFREATTTVISKNMCDRMRNLHKLNLKVRLVIGGQLIPEILDGCFVCETPSKFHIKWRSNSPILKNLTIDGFSDDIALAQNYKITVLSSDKANTILKKNPMAMELVGLIQFDGLIGKTSFVLNYNSPIKNEQYTVFKLYKGKWIETNSNENSAIGFKSKLNSSGVYAIAVRP